MGLGVERDGQGERMLEIMRHHRQATAMREAVGMQGHEHAGPDREQAEPDPRGQHREKLWKSDHSTLPLGTRQDVDDFSEQDRLREGGDRQQEIGERKQQAQSQLATEHSQHARIEGKERHSEIPTWQGTAAAATPTRMAIVLPA